jgi:hypothetical protein
MTQITTDRASTAYDRIPYLIAFDEVSAFKDTYGGAIGRAYEAVGHIRFHGARVRSDIGRRALAFDQSGR